jgi:hypothetical protein
MKATGILPPTFGDLELRSMPLQDPAVSCLSNCAGKGQRGNCLDFMKEPEPETQ